MGDWDITPLFAVRVFYIGSYLVYFGSIAGLNLTFSVVFLSSASTFLSSEQNISVTEGKMLNLCASLEDLVKFYFF